MLAYNSFQHGQVIQSPNHDCHEVYFITAGGVAVCESTCFSEPILIYSTGNVFNLYQTIVEKRLDYKFVAVDPD